MVVLKCLVLNVSKIKYYTQCDAEAGISISLSEAYRRITEATGVSERTPLVW
jgi:hypothetical protein